jgi:Bacterial archaeo-eukaryotic release factor family 7
MMRLLSSKDLLALADERDGPRVSIFLPVHEPGNEQQGPIRLRNLLREAEGRLAIAGLRHSRARDVLAPGFELAADTSFWRDIPVGGLALFLAGDGAQRLRLPYAPRELVVVGDRFHAKPLLPLLCGDGRFYLLALSQRRVRLFAGDREGLQELALREVPADLAEAMRFDDRHEELQLHQSGPARPGGRPAAIFHGHGVGADDAKDRILRYFREVDHGVQHALGNSRAPLVLAAVDYLRPLYRAASTYPHLLAQGLSGNPDHLDPHTLHRQAWTLVGDRFRSDQQAAAARCRALAHQDLATQDLDRIVLAAATGQIESLLVSLDSERWGTVDPVTGAAQLHREPRPGDVDLYDLAAVETLRHGGTAYPLPEGQTRPAAILRY